MWLEILEEDILKYFSHHFLFVFHYISLQYLLLQAKILYPLWEHFKIVTTKLKQ